MTDKCGESHPDDATISCTKDTPCFSQHAAVIWNKELAELGTTTWPNPVQAPVKQPKGKLAEKAQGVKPEVRVGAPTPIDRPTRHLDPPTSHEAARSTVEELRQSQTEVLALFTEPMTDEQLIAKALAAQVRQSESGLRTRRSELVTMGLLRDSGDRGRTKNDRDTIMWEPV